MHAGPQVSDSCPLGQLVCVKVVTGLDLLWLIDIYPCMWLIFLQMLTRTWKSDNILISTIMLTRDCHNLLWCRNSNKIKILKIWTVWFAGAVWLNYEFQLAFCIWLEVEEVRFALGLNSPQTNWWLLILYDAGIAVPLISPIQVDAHKVP